MCSSNSTPRRSHLLTWLIAGSLLGLLAIGPISAQDPGDAICIDADETLLDCFQRLLRKPADEIAVQATYAQLSELIAPGIDPQLASSLTDFLPGFLSTVGVGGLEADGLRLGFDNPLFSGRTGPLAYSLGAQLTDPELFDQLTKLIPEEGLADKKAALEEDLEDFDTVDIRFRISLEENSGFYRWGRNPQDYVDYLDAAFAETLAENAEAKAKDSLRELSRLLSTSTNPAVSPDLFVKNRSSFSPVEREQATEVEAAIRAAVTEEKKRLAAIDSSLESISELINNQPQLVLDVTRKERDELTGVSQWLYDLSFEKGFGNINQFARWARGHAQKELCEAVHQGSRLGRMYVTKPEFSSQKSCLERFLADHPDRGEKANRLSISIQYRQDDRYEFDDGAEENPLTLSLPARDKWVGSLTYGFELAGPSILQAGSEDSMRLDFEAAYEDPTGDSEEMRHNRQVYTATLTQRLTNGTSVSLSAIWANRDEFLGEVDEKLSANFGLKWKVDRKGD